MRAILVCVEYGDLLAVTLPYNRRQFDEVMVVTTPEDIETQTVASKFGAQTYCTDSFYKNGAIFNKWLALEEGLDKFGRHGWLCVMDADVLWSSNALGFQYAAGYLYGPRRRILTDTDTLVASGPPSQRLWYMLPPYGDMQLAGYTYIFHAADPALPDPPWHEVNWKHAGGADSMFQELWAEEKRILLPWEVLHIGLPGRNWCGRVTTRLDGRVPDQAGARKHALHTLIIDRHANRNKPDPYIAEKL